MSAKSIDDIIRIICEDQGLDYDKVMTNTKLQDRLPSTHEHSSKSKSPKPESNPTAFTRWKTENPEEIKEITKDIKGVKAKNEAVKAYWKNDLNDEERTEYEVAHENEKKSRVKKISEGVPEEEVSPDGRVKIKNPDTGKLVFKDGPTGKKILKKMKEMKESN